MPAKKKNSPRKRGRKAKKATTPKKTPKKTAAASPPASEKSSSPRDVTPPPDDLGRQVDVAVHDAIGDQVDPLLEEEQSASLFDEEEVANIIAETQETEEKDPEDNSSHNPKGKKIPKKKNCKLRDEEMEIAVLEWVEENPCLWNIKDKEFKNRDKKGRLWAEKGADIGYSSKFHFQ